MSGHSAALGGLPTGKMHCYVPTADTVRAAAADYRRWRGS